MGTELERCASGVDDSKCGLLCNREDVMLRCGIALPKLSNGVLDDVFCDLSILDEDKRELRGAATLGRSDFCNDRIEFNSESLCDLVDGSGDILGVFCSVLLCREVLFDNACKRDAPSVEGKAEVV